MYRWDVMAYTLRGPAALACLWFVSSCGGPDTADALIGPEGGVVSHDDGVTLTVPPGALLTTRQIVIRPSSESLSSGDYKQVGGAYLFEPRDLEFKVPAELTFESKDTPTKPVVLLRPDKRIIAYSGADDRAVAYIGSLGVAAMGSAGEPVATITAPALARTPAEVDLTSAAVNVAELKVMPAGTTVIDLGFTAFAPAGMSAAQLNGEGTAYCGFKLGMILGASITGGCSNGLTSATIGLSSPDATAQVVPFLIGKVSEPVIVEVQVGTGDLAVSAGYFAFKTSACYLESCAGHGLCDDSSGQAKCGCDDGYMANGLSCDCIPQCDGRQCGFDGCQGNCAPGCDANTHTCNGETGQCEPLPPPETSGPPMTTEPETSGTTMTPDNTTTDPSTTTSTSTTTSGESSTSGSSTGTTG
jgi:hypothetical protein